LKDPDNLIVKSHRCLSVGGRPKDRNNEGCSEGFKPHAEYFSAFENRGDASPPRRGGVYGGAISKQH